jgi:hypothetical protein
MKNLAIAIAVVLLLAILTGCGGGVVVQDRPVTVVKPVVQPCVEGPRPEPVVPLKERVDKDTWYKGLDAAQKSAYIAAQGLDRQTYGEQIAAATSACP